MRTVKLTFTGAALVDFIESLGAEAKDTQAAIGYLSVWAMDYAWAEIAIGHEALCAAYYREQPVDGETPAYVIGAVWHGDHFGFHS